MISGYEYPGRIAWCNSAKKKYGPGMIEQHALKRLDFARIK